MTEQEINKEMENATLAYKGFNHELKCRDMQYEVGKTYAKDSEEVRRCGYTGFHSCENPFDVLDYYSLINTSGKMNRFAEVITADKRDKENNKQSTSIIKIKAELNLKEFIKAAFDFLWSKNTPSSGDGSQLVSSGDGSQLASSGYNSQLASSGDSSQLASSGDGSKLASSGDNSQLASSGYNSQLASSGYNSKLASSGYNSQLASSGYNSQLASSGNNSQLASSGYNSKLASSGDGCVVANIGIKGSASAAKGSWIILAEYDDYGNIKCVKSRRVDGKKIKANTFYVLKNCFFTEVKNDNA
jgi:hypothetical protein